MSDNAKTNRLIVQLKEHIIDIMAFLVALTAVIISVNQSRIDNEYQRLDKQPLLYIEFIELDSEEMKGFKLYNHGFGPAIIKDFTVYGTKEDYKQKLNPKEDFLSAVGPKLGYFFDKVNNLPDEYVLAQNESIFLIGTCADSIMNYFIPNEITNKFYNSQTKKNMNQMVIEIIYKSMNPNDKYQYKLRFCPSMEPINKNETINL